jgi:hypothetical protein
MRNQFVSRIDWELGFFFSRPVEPRYPLPTSRVSLVEPGNVARFCYTAAPVCRSRHRVGPLPRVTSSAAPPLRRAAGPVARQPIHRAVAPPRYADRLCPVLPCAAPAGRPSMFRDSAAPSTTVAVAPAAHEPWWLLAPDRQTPSPHAHAHDG